MATRKKSGLCYYYLSEQNSFSPTSTDVGSVLMCGPVFGGIKDAP